MRITSFVPATFIHSSRPRLAYESTPRACQLANLPHHVGNHRSYCTGQTASTGGLAMKGPKGTLISNLKRLQHLWRGGVVAEGLDGRAGAALAEGAHGAGVAEEFLEWGVGFDNSHFATVIRLGDDRPPLLKVADEIAKVILGRNDVELHDRLQEHFPALF